MNSDAGRAKCNRTHLLGWIVLILPPLFWAGNFVVGRAARGEVPPMMLAFARHLVALVFLLPFGWATMRRDMKRHWEHRWQIVRVSLAGMVAFNLLVYLGLHSTTASNAQLMNSTIPVLIALLGAVLHKQRLTITQIFGLLLSCAGVLTIILDGDFARLLVLRLSHGDLMVIGAMVCFALFSVWLRAFPADMDRLGTPWRATDRCGGGAISASRMGIHRRRARDLEFCCRRRNALCGHCCISARQSPLHVRYRARRTSPSRDVHPSRSLVWGKHVDRVAGREPRDLSCDWYGRDHDRVGLLQHAIGSIQLSLACLNHFRNMASYPSSR